MTAFADTSALYAVLDADDESHGRAGEDHRGAVQALLAADRRGLSLVDCSSFLVMRRLGLKVAFAFDEDFGHQGFETVPG